MLKRISQLETGPDTFASEREWLSEQMEVVPRQGSVVWSSPRALIVMLTPLLLMCNGGSAEIRQLLS